MKTIFSLLVIMLLAAGCNKQKSLQKDLTGTWQAYKYLFHNADETQQFTNQYGTYTLTFSGTNKFISTFTSPDTTLTSGTYSFTDNNEQLILVDSTYVRVDTVYVASANYEQYTIFDLTATGMELFTDSSALYFNKKQ